MKNTEHQPDGLSHDIWRRRSNPLDAIFKPASVALIGATEKPGSVGVAILKNLVQSSFKGKIYPVNPKYSELMGVKAYPSVSAIGEPVDLAVIVTPSTAVPAVMEECVAAGVKGAIVISAGFKEIGPAGLELEQKTLEIARKGSIRIIGPNCLGVMNPKWGLNATFAGKIAKSGNVGFISQSGALCTAVLDWSLTEHVGFSSFVSTGSMADIGWGDLIDYLGDDPDTHSILMYMESIGDAHAFLSAAREVALSKPVIILKAGRSQEAAQAAISHTGSIAGSDEALDAAFKRCGVIRVNEISDLFNLAEILAKQPRPKGPNLGIVTNAGGPGVLATDAFIYAGGKLASLSPEDKENLNAFLPPQWSHNNPVDVLGDADSTRYVKAIETLSKSPEVNGLLVILTPQAMTDSTKTAEALAPYANMPDKPVLASWMGSDDVRDGRKILRRAGIPEFQYPDQAAKLFQYTWRYSENLNALYDTPSLDMATLGAEANEWKRKINDIRKSGRTILTETESKEFLSAYGIPTVPSKVAKTQEEAVSMANGFGYPVVLKLHSETITHKTDVGGVKLNLKSGEEVKNAFHEIRRAVTQSAGEKAFGGTAVQPMVTQPGVEVIVGSTVDPQLGPVILFGAGGKYVEIFKDFALGLPPLNTNLARQLIESTRIFEALKGTRGAKPSDIKALARVLVRFSRLLATERQIKEIEINPLLAMPGGVMALDARVVLHPDSLKTFPSLAIRPYPEEYIGQWKAPDGASVTIRPIRPEDEPLMVGFHHALSEDTIRRRYFRKVGLNERVAHKRLARVCFNDYDREIALVATGGSPEKIMGVARLSRGRGNRAEGIFSEMVADSFQSKGLGQELLRRIMDIAKKESFESVSALIPPDGMAMKRVCEKLGFTLEPENEGYFRAEIRIRNISS